MNASLSELLCVCSRGGDGINMICKSSANITRGKGREGGALFCIRGLFFLFFFLFIGAFLYFNVHVFPLESVLPASRSCCVTTYSIQRNMRRTYVSHFQLRMCILSALQKREGREGREGGAGGPSGGLLICKSTSSLRTVKIYFIPRFPVSAAR